MWDYWATLHHQITELHFTVWDYWATLQRQITELHFTVWDYWATLHRQISLFCCYIITFSISYRFIRPIDGSKKSLNLWSYARWCKAAAVIMHGHATNADCRRAEPHNNWACEESFPAYRWEFGWRSCTQTELATLSPTFTYSKEIKIKRNRQKRKREKYMKRGTKRRKWGQGTLEWKDDRKTDSVRFLVKTSHSRNLTFPQQIKKFTVLLERTGSYYGVHFAQKPAICNLFNGAVSQHDLRGQMLVSTTIEVKC